MDDVGPALRETPQLCLVALGGWDRAQTRDMLPAGNDIPAAPSWPPSCDMPDARARAERALDLMRLEAEGNVSIRAIADRVGIGLRCLQITFAAQYGVTPREMLTRLRLQKARAMLLAPPAGARVTAIALDAGFTHLSRFSQTYRQAYGECPVETLRRSQAGEVPQAAE